MKILVKNNYLYTDSKTYRCAVGLKGISQNKLEGDHCTPFGEFKFDKIYYRADKLGKMSFKVPFEEIKCNDGWCDDPDHGDYNRIIKFPFDGSAEKLFREDDLYDLICVISYNTNPVIPGKGSAIFLHVCENTFAHTEGCVAIEKEALLTISKQINRDTRIIIEG